MAIASLDDVRLADGSEPPTGAARQLLELFDPFQMRRFEIGRRTLRGVVSAHIGQVASDEALDSAIEPLLRRGFIEAHASYSPPPGHHREPDSPFGVTIREPDDGEPYFVPTPAGARAARLCGGLSRPGENTPWLFGDERIDDQVMLAAASASYLTTDSVTLWCCNQSEASLAAALERLFEGGLLEVARNVGAEGTPYRLTVGGQTRAKRLLAEARETAKRLVAGGRPRVPSARPMLAKPKIIALLETLHEHKMAEDIFVPVLSAMGLKGVRFTGGAEEHGIDIEYWEYTQPERRRSPVGIQFKKGSIVYKNDATSKGSVQTIRNQADDAFAKEIVDLDDHATRFIRRFIVAATGEVNEPARRMIGKARQGGADRQIDYWDGDRLAEYIQKYWMVDFEEYFAAHLGDDGDVESDDDVGVVDGDYIFANYKSLVQEARKTRKAVGAIEWKILRALISLTGFDLSRDVTRHHGSPSTAKLSDLLIELGKKESVVRPELDTLCGYDFISFDDDGDLRLAGRAICFWTLAGVIRRELSEAEEDESGGAGVFDELVV